MIKKTQTKVIEYITEQLFIGNIEIAIELINIELSKELEEDLRYKLIGLKGIGLAHQGKFEEAIENLSEALTKKTTAELKYWRSVVYLETEHFQEALKDARMACELEGNNIDYEHNLINLLQILGEDNEMIQRCGRLINQFGKDYFAIGARGYGYIKIGKYNKALDDYLFLVEEGLLDAGIANNIGYCYDKLGDYKLAKEQYELCLSINPYHAYARNNLGYLYCQEGKLKKGIKLIKASIKYDKANSYAYKNMGKALLLKGEREKAFRILKKSQELGYREQYDDEVDEILRIEFNQ